MSTNVNVYRSATFPVCVFVLACFLSITGASAQPAEVSRDEARVDEAMRILMGSVDPVMKQGYLALLGKLRGPKAQDARFLCWITESNSEIRRRLAVQIIRNGGMKTDEAASVLKRCFPAWKEQERLARVAEIDKAKKLVGALDAQERQGQQDTTKLWPLYLTESVEKRTLLLSNMAQLHRLPPNVVAPLWLIERDGTLRTSLLLEYVCAPETSKDSLLCLLKGLGEDVQKSRAKSVEHAFNKDGEWEAVRAEVYATDKGGKLLIVLPGKLSDGMHRVSVGELVITKNTQPVKVVRTSVMAVRGQISIVCKTEGKLTGTIACKGEIGINSLRMRFHTVVKASKTTENPNATNGRAAVAGKVVSTTPEGRLSQTPTIICVGRWQFDVLQEWLATYCDRKGIAPGSIHVLSVKWADPMQQRRLAQGDYDLLVSASEFPHEAMQAQRYICAQGRVALVSPKESRWADASTEFIRHVFAFRPKGYPLTPKCYGESEGSIAQEILRSKCMMNARPFAGTFLAFRDDLGVGKKPVDVIREVRKTRSGVGFFLWGPDMELQGVKLLPIKAENASVELRNEPVMQLEYPLAENIVLYVRDEAQAMLKQFAAFCQGEEGAKIAAKHGLITPWHQKQYEGELRLKAFKSGKGERLIVVGAGKAVGGKELLARLNEAYVKARKVVQVRYIAAGSEMSAVGYFLADRKGSEMELLLLNGKPSQRAMKIHGKKWEALWKSSDGKPAEHVIAGRGVAIVVHSLNKIESLTFDQVRAIFAGKVRDWKILAGGSGGGIRPEKAASLEIHRFGLHRPDPAADLFYEKVLDSHLCGAINRKKGTTAVLAALSIDPQSIAFVNFADLPADLDKSSIKVLGVGPADKAIAPITELILDSSYPLSRRLHLYVSPKASDVTKDFVKFVLSGVCAETFVKNGLVVPPAKPQGAEAEEK